MKPRPEPDGIIPWRIVLVQPDRTPCPGCGAHRFRDASRIYCTVCGHWWWRCIPKLKCKTHD